MSLANLSLLSPAIPISASTSGRSFPFSEPTVQGRKSRSKPLTKDLWCDTPVSASGSFEFASHDREREGSISPKVARTALPVDPLAALAAARPVSNRKGMHLEDEQDQWRSRSRSRSPSQRRPNITLLSARSISSIISLAPGYDERSQNDGYHHSQPHSDSRDERLLSRESSVHAHESLAQEESASSALQSMRGFR
ncbi:hypothetical protein BT96DRAFT_567792 [Gymnopus androsaceus JB14]|uniref:Uncharacterized protein n=1 Tax=Gymnopus androsaceus JB14 TaxID=1447944 RepID=A0A6A4GJJ6_9AGAR|nr:hypothetical protein BT96DRAFT_567792 [Gymnopus androsaceus JB14]